MKPNMYDDSPGLAKTAFLLFGVACLFIGAILRSIFDIIRAKVNL